MPWKETHVEGQRLDFISDWQRGSWSMAALCRRYSISRKTGYVWVARYKEEGVCGLKERTSAPHSCSHRLSPEVEERIVLLRRLYTDWGPEKLKSWLEEHEPLEQGRWPAASTIGTVLDRNGLTQYRRARRQTPPYGQPLLHCREANDVWSVDFKGWFLTGDGRQCHPFTMSDNYSRYLLKVQCMQQTDSGMVRPSMIAAFREHGLPIAIRSDNGAPFASTGLCALSRLNVWWIQLGIRPERIEPGKPQQNGRHERMHRTLKQALNPVQPDLRRQQIRLEQFRCVYNEQRPHAALGQVAPARVYRASERRYPSRLKGPEYNADLQVRRVRHNGEIRWKGGYIT